MIWPYQNKTIQRKSVIKILKQFRQPLSKSQISYRFMRLLDKGVSPKSIQKILSHPEISRELNLTSKHSLLFDKVIEKLCRKYSFVREGIEKGCPEEYRPPNKEIKDIPNLKEAIANYLELQDLGRQQIFEQYKGVQMNNP